MNFIQWFFSPRSKEDWKSWNSLFLALPLVFGTLVFTIPKVLQDDGAAKRQQTTTGTVTAYDRSNHNQCQYVFEVQGKRYGGMGSVPTGTASVGEHMQVYFDSRDPAINSLRDFSSTTRGDESMGAFLVLGICGFTVLIIYGKLRRIKDQD